MEGFVEQDTHFIPVHILEPLENGIIFFSNSLDTSSLTSHRSGRNVSGSGKTFGSK